MVYSEYKAAESEFVDDTLALIHKAFTSVYEEFDGAQDRDVLRKLRNQFVTGKMLRTRLGMVLCDGEIVYRDDIIRACAATELIHAATLFHDDVIDEAAIRRNQPSLWREVGSTGAILIGDLFFSTAVKLIVQGRDVNRITSFVDKVREVCATEMVHEISYRDRDIDVETCVSVARGKTGPLFAFVAEVCGCDDSRKSAALQEAGYLLGTAYQIADDLLDVVGDESKIGKTLGTDKKRCKFTLAQSAQFSESFIREKIESLCNASFAYLRHWPDIFPRLEQYIVSDLLPYWDLKLEIELEQSAVYELG